MPGEHKYPRDSGAALELTIAELHGVMNISLIIREIDIDGVGLEQRGPLEHIATRHSEAI